MLLQNFILSLRAYRSNPGPSNTFIDYLSVFVPWNNLILFIITLFCLFWPLEISAQSARKAPPVIRDTEIESILKEWSAPLLKAAQMAPGSVNVILVQSSDVNAFVAGGSNIFFYTGLLEKTTDPGEILGVFAHELGHISGSHLILARDALERASYESILGTVLGIGAAILSGDSGAAGAVIAGGNSVAQRRFLAHSRVNESSADQAALSYFEKAELNSAGLVSFMEKLQDQELLPSSRQVEYVRTHPLTRNRIDALRARATKSSHYGVDFPAHWYDQHARIKAKLIGFISPGRVAWAYDDRDSSIPARYARTIAAYRENRIDEAIAGIDALIKDEPNNPYFYELKGQMLVDFSRIEDALPAYRKSVEILPHAGLLRIALAHALIESGDDAVRLKNAIQHLERAGQTEPRSSRIHRLLATAHGRLGDENMAKVHLAEEAVLQRRISYAKQLTQTVFKTAAKDSRSYHKARDLLAHIETLKPGG